MAGGENIGGAQDFASMIEQGAPAALQADIAKRVGVTGCPSVARATLSGALLPAVPAGRRRPRRIGHPYGRCPDDRLLAVHVSPDPVRDAFGP